MVNEINLTLGETAVLIWFLIVLLVSILHLFYRDDGEQVFDTKEETANQTGVPRPVPWVGGSFLR